MSILIIIIIITHGRWFGLSSRFEKGNIWVLANRIRIRSLAYFRSGKGIGAKYNESK